MEDKEIIVYVEKVSVNGKYLLLDFPPVKEEGVNHFDRFIEAVNYLGDLNGDIRTMLEITNINFEKAPIEGKYYEIPKEILDVENWIKKADNNFHVSLTASDEIKAVKFEKKLDKKDYVEHFKKTPNGESKVKEAFSNYASNNIYIKVFDIGQGSFNKISFNDEQSIIYDFGSMDIKSKIIDKTKISLKQNIRLKKLAKICKNNKNNNINFVLSHWDIDHYSGLLNLDDNSKKAINKYIVPNVLYSQTSKRVIKSISSKSIVINIPPQINKSIKIKSIFSNKVIILYKSSQSCDINKSGLLLIIKNKDKCIIFPGDHHYNQIDKYIIPNIKNDKKYLVVPHHGGNAGTPSIIKRWDNLEEAIISSGENIWKHPKGSVLEVLVSCSISKLHITKINKDYTLNL